MNITTDNKVTRSTYSHFYHFEWQTTLKALCFIVFMSLISSCAETLPSTNAEDITFSQTEYDKADIIIGGKLYDNWFKQKGINPPAADNPIWRYTANRDSGVQNNGGQWQCSECHGWDYKGRDGAYGDSSSIHYSGVLGLNSTNLNFTPESVFLFIANGAVNIENGISNSNAPETAHDFFAQDKLDARDIADLTKFIILFANIDSVDSIIGDSTQGEIIYAREGISGDTCASIGCHSINQQLIINSAQLSEAVFLHKVRIGSPGTLMPGGLSNEEAQDLLAFVKFGEL